jgi:hypothetical protein
VHENRNHHHTLVYEWLLEQAKKLGIHGASAFKAVAGFRRHCVLHEDHFFRIGRRPDGGGGTHGKWQGIEAAFEHDQRRRIDPVLHQANQQLAIMRVSATNAIRG